MKSKLKKFLSKAHKKLQIARYYGQRLTFSRTHDSKTIVICFNGIFSHGGLIDRFKGIISFYEISKRLNCDFKIQFDHPFDLSVYFTPNSHNWKLNRKVRYNPFDTQVLYLMDKFDFDPLNFIQQSAANTILVYCNVDYSRKLFPDAQAEFHAERWRENFNALFRKSAFLSSELSKLPQQKHLVFHTRFTSLMGDFKDSSAVYITDDEKNRLMQSLVRKMNQRSALFPDCDIFVLSDSTIFLDYVKKHTAFNVLPGTPKHVDIKNNNSDLESHTKTLTDFYFIANSESVYLLKEGGMYMSGFSKYAAVLGDKKFEVIQ